MSSSPPPNAHCYNAPLSPEAVEGWFDSDGRLVKEAEMRKALFKGTYVCTCTSVIVLVELIPHYSHTQQLQELAEHRLEW